MSFKKIPQINPKNGISQDYANEFFARGLLISMPEKLKQSIKDLPIKKYEEYFSQNGYSNIINKKNESLIKELNDIVDVLNSFGKSELTIQDYTRFSLKAKSIIYMK